MELVAGVVAGGAVVVALLAVGVAAACRCRARQHGTYNVDAATVNGYAGYEVCTTSSSVGTGSTTTIGGSRRKARATAGPSATAESPSGGGARKAGRTKKVVREWYV